MLETLIQWLDWLGVVVFALTGCLVAARRGVDIIGFILLATVTGIGGGTMRDVVLGQLPVFWVLQPVYLWLCLSTACIAFIFTRLNDHLLHRQYLLWADALGLALFSVLGCSQALAANAPPIVAICMGVMTATFGGIIRDLLASEPTLIFRREIYVTASALGAFIYWLLAHVNAPSTVAIICGVCAAFALRTAGLYWRLSLPGYGAKPTTVDCERRHHL